jgi:alkaline phosphatase
VQDPRLQPMSRERRWSGNCINRNRGLRRLLGFGTTVLTASFLPLQIALAQTPKDWFADGRAAVERARDLNGSRGRTGNVAKNVILFVGDGMGISTVTAARILEGQRRGESGEENLLSFERFPYVSLAKTYNTNQQTPDSAGTITAMVTGSKTRAGVISVDETVERGDFAAVDQHRLETIVEQAETRGLSTGLVTTTTVTHATPAALYGHSPERNWEWDTSLSVTAREAGFPDLARQLIEFRHGDGMEVVLGGGQQGFRPNSPSLPSGRNDGRDLTSEWVRRASGSVYVESCAALSKLDPETTEHLLGLFSASHMQFEADREKSERCEPSLSEMTSVALTILQRNSKGYFLLIEGGRIDHGHHSNNAYRALTDAIEFSNAVKLAVEKTAGTNTLIVVTADHGHVFTIAGYPKRGNDILGVVVGNDLNPPNEPSLDGLGKPYTTLGYQNGPGYLGKTAEQPEGPKRFPHLAASHSTITQGRPNLTTELTSDPDYLQESTVPLFFETHSAEDVPIYAAGPGASLFHGVQEQNFVYHAMVEALGWNQPPAAVSDE